MNYQYVYDLDDKINLLYDCVYNSTTKNEFLVDNINLQNITISDIKFTIPDFIRNASHYSDKFNCSFNCFCQLTHT